VGYKFPAGAIGLLVGQIRRSNEINSEAELLNVQGKTLTEPARGEFTS
jgi:hypothetical protein